MKTNEPICSGIGGIFTRQLLIMAAGHHRRILDAISSLGDDGIIVSPDDRSKYVALLGDYFTKNSDSDSDASGSEEDVACGKFVNSLKRCVTILQSFHRHCTYQQH